LVLLRIESELDGITQVGGGNSLDDKLVAFEYCGEGSIMVVFVLEAFYVRNGARSVVVLLLLYSHPELKGVTSRASEIT